MKYEEFIRQPRLKRGDKVVITAPGQVVPARGGLGVQIMGQLDWDITIPPTPLPTKVGAVIRTVAGEILVKVLDDDPPYTTTIWVSKRADWYCDTDIEPGFTVLSEGIDIGDGSEP